jgi:hypothetical protein
MTTLKIGNLNSDIAHVALLHNKDSRKVCRDRKEKSKRDNLSFFCGLSVLCAKQTEDTDRFRYWMLKSIFAE